MSGQYAGCQGGQGQGGRRRGRYKSSATKHADKKKTINEYFFYVGSTKQALDYKVTSNFIINHIKKTYDYGIDTT